VPAFSAAAFKRKKKMGIHRCFGCGGTNKVRDVDAGTLKGEYCRECVP